jgi:hypothetical protein
MNNGPEGKNTQEICIDEKGTRRIVPSSFLLSSRREREKRSVDIRKTCFTVVVVVVFFVHFFFSFSLYHPQMH